MRVESDHWIISSGVVGGHYHVHSGKNCQDAAVILATPELAVGVGCDGCGEGLHSEVGAWSIANFTANGIQALHSLDHSIEEILPFLFSYIINFIGNNIRFSCPSLGSGRVADYVKNYWLSTIMGMIATKDQITTFWCGDGVISSSTGPLVAIDQNNTPRYIAHNCLLLPEKHGITTEHTPTEFSHICSPIGDAPIKMMVASDGFTTICEDKFAIALTKQPELPRDLNGLQWGKSGNFGLKKWMNANLDRGHFDDDCFIITAEQKEKQ